MGGPWDRCCGSNVGLQTDHPEKKRKSKSRKEKLMVVVYVRKEGDTIFLLIGSPRVCDHRLHLINRQPSASGAGCVRFKVGFIRPQPSSVWEILTIRSAALERPMLDFSAIFPLLFYFDLFFGLHRQLCGHLYCRHKSLRNCWGTNVSLRLRWSTDILRVTPRLQIWHQRQSAWR